MALPAPVSSAGRALAGGAVGIARRLRPDAATRPPWERSVLEDVAASRPWNVVVKVARARARRRISTLEEGLTVVVVSWNTAEVLGDVLTVVRALTPGDVEVLVVDNGSTDGTRTMLQDWPAVRVIELHGNAGHGVALDLALCSVRTRTALTLDSDAIPLTPDWVGPAVDPVRSGRATLAGLRSSRGYVHPVYLAIDVPAFLEGGLSFQVHRADAAGDTQWGQNAWDTGELMTARVGADRVVFVEPTPNAAEGLPGMTAGGVVYHHGGVTRGPGGATAVEGWRSACRALGLGPLLADRWAEPTP